MHGDPMMAALMKMASGGWKDLDNLETTFGEATREASREEEAEKDRQAAIAATCLDNPAGQALLHLLLSKTLLRPATDEERAAVTAEAYAIAKAKREGQSQIVFTLLAMLQRHAGKKDQPDGGLS